MSGHRKPKSFVRERRKATFAHNTLSDVQTLVDEAHEDTDYTDFSEAPSQNPTPTKDLMEGIELSVPARPVGLDLHSSQTFEPLEEEDWVEDGPLAGLQHRATTDPVEMDQLAREPTTDLPSFHYRDKSKVSSADEDAETKQSQNKRKKKRKKKKRRKVVEQTWQAGEDLTEEWMEPWLISPTSTVKAAWDVWILLLLVFLLLFLPIRLAFEPAGYEALKVGTTHMVDLFIDVCFLADIFVNFFTAYQNRFGHIVTDRSKIASRYVKSWFLLDVVSTFPFHMVIDDRSANIASLAKVPRLLKLIRLLRFLRLLKAYRFKQLMEAVEYSRHVHPSVFRIFKLLAYVLVFAHVGACFWYFLGEMQETEEAWIHRHWNDGPSISDESGMTKYITSMYWLLTTLTTIGYGDITPRTDSEMWFANLIMIMGTIFFAYTTASVSSILVTTDNDNSGLREKMSELRVFIRGFKLSPGLSKMLTQHMKTKWEKPTINSKQDWTELMRAMPPRIRTRVVKYVYSDLIKRSPLFSAYSQKGCGEQFLIDIFHNLHPMQRTKGDVVVSRDEPFTEWYIVQEGKVNAVSSHDHSFVYMHFKDGMSFGEIPLFLDRDAWEYTAIVDSKICFLLSIDANVLQRLFVKDYHTAKNRRLPTTAFVEKLVASTSRRLVALKRAKQARLTARTAREPRSRWTRDKSIIGTLKLRDAQIKVPDIHVMDLMTDTTGKKSKQLMLTMYKELKSMSASMKSMQSQIQQLAVSNAKLSSFKAQHETKIEQKSPRKKLRERPPARGSILRDAPLRISGVTDLDSDDDPNEARSPSPPMYGDEDR